MDPAARPTLRHRLLVGLGWLLLAAGVVAFPLPGPGLLLMALGAGLLVEHQPWAARRLEPLRGWALARARHQVATRRRTALSATLAALLGASGVLWLVDPAVPGWWTLPTWLWLAGGTWSGVGQIASGGVAVLLVLLARRRLGAPR